VSYPAFCRLRQPACATVVRLGASCDYLTDAELRERASSAGEGGLPSPPTTPRSSDRSHGIQAGNPVPGQDFPQKRPDAPPRRPRNPAPHRPDARPAPKPGCSATRYAQLVADGRLWWEDEDAAHIRTRSTRYPGAPDIDPAWTLEAAADPDRVLRNPVPRSRVGYPRLIGHSPTADFVITLIADPDDWSGVHRLEDHRSRPARLRPGTGAHPVTDITDQARAARRARHAAILAEVATEEAEATEAEATANNAALVVPLHLRIDRDLDTALRHRADTEHIPTSALVRRLLRQAVHDTPTTALTEATVEDIARRVTREELRAR